MGAESQVTLIMEFHQREYYPLTVNQPHSPGLEYIMLRLLTAFVAIRTILPIVSY